MHQVLLAVLGRHWWHDFGKLARKVTILLSYRIRVKFSICAAENRIDKCKVNQWMETVKLTFFPILLEIKRANVIQLPDKSKLYRKRDILWLKSTLNCRVSSWPFLRSHFLQGGKGHFWRFLFLTRVDTLVRPPHCFILYFTSPRGRSISASMLQPVRHLVFKRVTSSPSESGYSSIVSVPFLPRDTHREPRC